MQSEQYKVMEDARMRFRLTVGVFAVAGLMLGACGGGDNKQTDEAAPATGAAAAPAGAPAAVAGVPRRVEIEMVDIGFKPATIDV